MRIGSKTILILVAVAVLAVAVMAGLFFIQGEKALIERVEAQLRSVVVLKESQLNHFIESATKQLEDISELNIIQDYLSGFYYPSQEKMKTEIFVTLKRKLDFTQFMEIFLMTIDGKVEISTDINQAGKTRGKEKYFVQGKEKTYIQNFYYDITLNKLAITMSTPIRDETGNTVGVLIGRMDLAEISDLMAERSGLGITGETYLVNKSNHAVSELKKEAGAVLVRAIYTESVKDCLRGKEAFSHHTDYAGDEVFGIYKWLPEEEVCLLAEIDREEVLELIRGYRTLVPLVSSGIVVFLAIIGILFSKLTRVLSDRTAELEAKTRELEEAKSVLEIKVEDRTKELRGLAESLEEQIRERTKELQNKVEELEKFNRLAVGRELKMVELKKEIKKLESELAKTKGWKIKK